MSSKSTFLDPKTGVAQHNAAERQVDVASILIEAAVELRNAGGPQSKAAAKRLAEKLDVAATALDRSSKITKSGAGQVASAAPAAAVAVQTQAQRPTGPC